jgi:hypothetical protein
MSRKKRYNPEPEVTPEASTPEPTPEPEPAAMVEPQPAPKTKAGVFRVADGKSVTTQRGMCHGGDVVRPRDFAGGQKTLDALVSKGTVVAS